MAALDTDLRKYLQSLKNDSTEKSKISVNFDEEGLSVGYSGTSLTTILIAVIVIGALLFVYLLR